MVNVSKLKVFMLIIIGMMTVNSVYAYDDIYATTKAGAEFYGKKKSKVKKEDKVPVANYDDMIVLKSKGLKLYTASDSKTTIAQSSMILIFTVLPVVVP